MTDLWCSFPMSVLLTMNFSSTHLYPGNCYLASMDFKRSLYIRLSSLSHSFYISPISLSCLFFFSFFFKYFSLNPRSSVTLTSLHHWVIEPQVYFEYTLTHPIQEYTIYSYSIINIVYLLGLTTYNIKGYII